MKDLEKTRTDTLILLVGTNPLPNLVAACLLVKDGGNVFLLATRGPGGTHPVAKRLKKAIAEACPEVGKIEVVELRDSFGDDIYKELKSRIESSADGSVGLSYTGGTKAMAVHAYRAVDKIARNPVFTYLDARTLSVIVEEPLTGHSRILVGDKCHVSLQDMLGLHGYKRLEPWKQEGKSFDLAEVLATVHAADPEVAKQWGDWVRKDALAYPPDSKTYPALAKVRDAIDGRCKCQATDKDLARLLGFDALASASKWLQGEWLEEYSLWALTQVAEECGIGEEYGMNIKPKRPGHHEFELDVAAVRGYQLFAISCKASDHKGRCKQHLLEAFVRARQIGGDEARVALVCFYRDPDALQQEVNESWFAEGQIKVFGRQDLPCLPDRFRDWFKTANPPIKS